MSHLTLKKQKKGYKIYDKKKEKFVGTVMKNKNKAEKVTHTRDRREDKKK